MNARLRLVGTLIGLGLVAGGCERSKGNAPPSATAPAEQPAARVPASNPAWVEIDPKGEVQKAVAEQAAGAITAGKRPFLYLHADWCKPCVAIQASRADPLMVKAFAGTHIIALDVDTVPEADLAALGAKVDMIPTFFAVGP